MDGMFTLFNYMYNVRWLYQYLKKKLNIEKHEPPPRLKKWLPVKLTCCAHPQALVVGGE